jgi:hypothetical protein
MIRESQAMMRERDAAIIGSPTSRGGVPPTLC